MKRVLRKSLAVACALAAIAIPTTAMIYLIGWERIQSLAWDFVRGFGPPVGLAAAFVLLTWCAEMLWKDKGAGKE